MSMPIEPLAPHVIHHIAAGEVIDRPVSVVKELVENALDAGATRIEIEIEKGGLQLIKVSDNGHGIAKTDAEFIFSRYSTSKLAKLEDLYALNTYGFRGEALFSIMSVADVSIRTKHDLEEVGYEIATHHGQVSSITPIGTRSGTTIEVRNLFQQFPVRLQSLQPKKEYQVLLKLIQSFVLSQPKVTFLLKHDNKIILSAFGQEDIPLRIENIWNLHTKHQLFFEGNHVHGSVQGWISTPEFFSSNKAQQLIVVNNRLIFSSTIHKAIETGLKNFKHTGKHPRYFLSLQLNPHILDVNIHPQKKQVSILHEPELLEVIRDSLHQALEQQSAKSVRYTASRLFSSDYLPVKDSPQLKIIGDIQQLDHTYLLATTTQGIILVDQHAADERLWYNKLRKDKKLLQKLELHLTEACKNELHDDIYQHSFNEEIDARIATIACHQAIRAGESLGQEIAKELILQITQGGMETLVCPHGRPTHMFITKHQLDRTFRRR